MSTPIRPLSSTELAAPAVVSDERPDCLLPEAEDRTALESAAETVGATLGRAVHKVRDIPRHFTVIRGGASHKASELTDQAGTKFDDLKVQARDKAQVVSREFQNRAQMIRFRVRQTINQYPLQCLGGVFGAAFLTGMTLRIWRTRD